MKHQWRSRRRLRPRHDPDLDSALDAMTADELRSFIRDALERFDDEPRGQLVDSLVRRAAKGSSRMSPILTPSEISHQQIMRLMARNKAMVTCQPFTTPRTL